MKTAKRTAPFLRWLMASGCMLLCVGASGQAVNTAKRVLHNDGTITESVSDLSKGELRESTFDSRRVLLSKRIVLLNESGLPVQGVIYGGNDEMVGRVEFIYDDLGRVSEERNLNARGQVFRRKFQTYDQSGKALPEKVVDYAANAPRIPANSINFTNVVPPPDQGSSATPGGGQGPNKGPQIQSVSPQAKPAKPEEKKSLFNKIFNR